MNKLSRDAFLYLNPEPHTPDFAQCSSCQDWVREDNRCIIHGPRVRTPGSASCGFYIFGDPQPPGTGTEAVVSAEESGLVDREVRCENCQWGGPSTYKCRLFIGLNERLPDVFDLDEHIEPKGCCNGNLPADTKS
jgi:hypothetical protein